MLMEVTGVSELVSQSVNTQSDWHILGLLGHIEKENDCGFSVCRCVSL